MNIFWGVVSPGGRRKCAGFCQEWALLEFASLSMGWVIPSSLPWKGFLDFSLLTRTDMTDLSFQERGNFGERLSRVTLLYTLTPEHSSIHACTPPCPPFMPPPRLLPATCHSVPQCHPTWTPTASHSFRPPCRPMGGPQDLSSHCIDGHTSTRHQEGSKPTFAVCHALCKGLWALYLIKFSL